MPVLLKEVRGRMRGIGAPLTFTLYVAILAAILYGVFSFASRQFMFGGQQIATMGVQLFSILNIFQMLLVVFIAPTLTSGAIANEKERQTFDLLLSTRLSGFGILFGKLVAGIGYAILLILSSLPLFALVFVFGGVPMTLLFRSLVVQIATAITLGCFGLLFSTISKRSQIATVLSVVLSLVLVFGTTVAAIFMPIFDRPVKVMVAAGKPGAVVPAAPQTPKTPKIYYVNPLVALSSAMSIQGAPMGMMIPLPLPGIHNNFQGVNGEMALWKVHVLLDAGACVVLFLISWLLLDPRPRGWLVWRRRRRAPDVPSTAG